MYVAYRVRRGFGWDGWQYKPGLALETNCECAHRRCPYRLTDECRCRCLCGCALRPADFAGDIFVVVEGHPRLETMLSTRCVVSDPTIDVDELLKFDNFQHLTAPIYGTGVQRRRLYNNG